MYDMILISKIFDELNKICIINNINKVKIFIVIVNYRSYVNEENFYNYF